MARQSVTDIVKTLTENGNASDFGQSLDFERDAGKAHGRGQDSSPNFGEAISQAEAAEKLDVSTGYIQEAKKRM